MAAKGIQMNTFKELVRLHKDGVSNRAIGRALSLNKKTVNKYVAMADTDPLGLDGLLALEEPVLEHRLKSGNPAYSDIRFEALSERLDYITKELQRTGVTLLLLWEEYKQEVPDSYGYTQFCYHVKQHLKASKLSWVLKDKHEAGKELYVDFAGKTMSYTDTSTGEIVPVQIFVATLPSSDYGFAMAVPSQKIEDFLYAIEECFRFIGGVPKILVTDNLKSAVNKSDRYQPDINTMMSQFADHYGCVVIPTRPGKPKDKALVENHVKLTYQRVFAPLRDRQFFSIDSLNEAIIELVRKHNQKRMQRLDVTREERFLAVDKPLLAKCREERFEVQYRTELTVCNDSHIYLGRDKHHYSVPFKYIGKKVSVIYTRRMLEVYHGGEKIASHLRDTSPGRRTTVKSHLPSYYSDYTLQTPKMYIERAYKRSVLLGEVFSRLFSTIKQPPEYAYKGCDGMLHLQKTTDEDIFNLACETALSMDMCNYKFIKNLVESRCAGVYQNELAATDEDMFPSSDHSNIRDKSYYKSTLN